MNRLCDLRHTLPVNIKNSQGYSDIKFLLLDYNSQDGLGDWVQSELGEYLESDRLNYYKLLDPQPDYFSHAHSKNVAFRLATGNIFCNVNADQFVESVFFEYVPSQIPNDKPVALVSDFNNVEKDNFGRICLRNQDFFNIGGFDERFRGYGYEDIDLCIRLNLSGVTLKVLSDEYCGRYVKHDDAVRIENMFDYHHIKHIYVRRVEKGITEVIFLFRSGSMEMGTLKQSEHNIPILLEKRWTEGIWLREGEQLRLRPAKGDHFIFQLYKEHDRNIAKAGVHLYEEVTNKSTLKKIIMLKSQVLNYQLMKEHKRSQSFRANPQGFGDALVQKNFSEEVLLSPKATANV